MVMLGCISIHNIAITTLASLPSNASHRPTPVRRSSKIAAPKPNHNKQTQPSVAEIEQAIGAGVFRDHDPSSETEEKKSVFDVILSNSIGKKEGSTERTLRETGEWMSGQTERAARSSAKKILEVMFLWVAPAWLLFLLVATGAVKLPFSFPVLDDLIL